MMSGDLFVKKRPSETIEQFRGKFCEVLGIQLGEQRFSDNYAEGTYFRTDCLGVRVQIEAADDTNVADFDYHVHFRARVHRLAAERATMEGIADLVAVELVGAGYDVLRLSSNSDGPSGGRIRRRCVLSSDGSLPQFVQE